MPSGRYRVAINGFSVRAETWDDALNWDGQHDEVQISVSVKLVDKNGTVLYDNQGSTPVMGDTNGFATRIKAGSASIRGGLTTGDTFPTSTPWLRTIPLSVARDYPPFSVWEGELTQGEHVVFITPSIWEWDPGQSMWEGWLQWHKEIDDKYGKKAKEIVSSVIPPAGWIFDAVSLGIQTAATLTEGGPIGSSGSRPIGMKRDANNTGKFTFNPQVLALNYDLAERLISDDPWGRGRGVLVFTYRDDPYLRGEYLLYLQVEKVGSTTPVDRWDPLGGQLTSSPAVSSWDRSRLDIFVRSTDNALWHKWYEGRWGEWESLGGMLTSDPAAVSWGPHRIDVFARSTDNALWHKWYDQGWSEWESLGGILTSGPAVSSWDTGRLDVFVRGTDNALWHKWFDQGWSHWESLGGMLTSDPAAVSWGPHRIDVFARSADNALWHKWYDQGWSEWESLGGDLTSGPAAASWDRGRLDIFVRGADNALWHKWHDQGWSEWESLGGTFTLDPDAVSWGPNRTDVFVRGTDSTLLHKFWDGQWGP